MAQKPTEHQVNTMSRAFVDAGLREPDREVYFAIGRQWRFDLGWPEWMIAVEYEGGSWTGGNRHTAGAGYRADVDKYNEAAALGWCVIRATADMVREVTYLAPVLMALELRKQGVVLFGVQNDENNVPSMPELTSTPEEKPDPWLKAQVGGQD
jgi:hypothetical protein